MKIPPFDSLVWGSLRLAPIITVTFPRQHSIRRANAVLSGKCCWMLPLATIATPNITYFVFIQVQRFGWLPITIWHANNSHIPQTEQHEPTQRANAVPCGKCSLITNLWLLSNIQRIVHVN